MIYIHVMSGQHWHDFAGWQLIEGPLVNSVHKDILIPRVEIKVRTFKHFGALGWGRDTLNPAIKIGGYTSREGIS